MKPFISIIVPVYNVEKELSRCIDSILQQTIEDWELILIDDGSSDQSPQICNQYQSKDNRIKVFHKKNEGVSAARNNGIDLSNGTWLTFVDSDDYITPAFLETFVDSYNSQHFDLFMGDVQQIGLDGTSFVEYGLVDTTCDLKDAVLKHKILRSGDLHGKLFKRDIISTDLRFNTKVKYSEDRIFFDLYLAKSKHICFRHDVCYCYYRNPEGLSYKLNSFASEHEGYLQLKKGLKSIGENIETDYRSLIHYNPVIRTLKAAVNDLDYTEFKSFCEIQDKDDLFVFSRFFSLMRFGSFVDRVYRNGHYRILFCFLLIYFKLKNCKL